jgi:hypothetical protein
VEKGILCVDLSLIPSELMEVTTFFMLLEQKGVVFYDSRKNPKAVPPYAILGGLGDVTILDVADDKVRAKFDLMIKLDELEESENGDSNS